MTIGRVVELYPELRPALQEQGIDLCCGGAHTIAQVCEIRGLDAGAILTTLRARLAASRPGSESLRGSDSIRAILARHPETFPVFERHGLTGCGGASGPDERIDLFATVHRLDVNALLAELNDAIKRGTAPAPSMPPPLRAVYPGFIQAALGCALTLGATFGAYNLLVIHWALGPMPPSHSWVHAGFQIWGFVFLFIAGVAYHALPRFLGTELRRPDMAKATLWLTLAGQVLLGWGRLGELVPGSVAALAAGAGLQFLGALGFGTVCLSTWRASKAPSELFHAFLGAGTLGWIAAAGLLVAGAVEAVLEGDADAAVRWNQGVYAAALFSGALAWIQGMFLRTGAHFLALRDPRRSLLNLSLALGQLGTLAMVAGALRIRRPDGLWLLDGGLATVALSAALFVAGVRPFRSSAPPSSSQDARFARATRLAFGGALVFSALGMFYGVADLIGGASGLIHDGARHAFTLGFVTPLIFAMAGRILPVFSGADLRWPALHAWGLGLIVAGFLLREAQVGVALFGAQELIKVSGVSGIVAATGVLLASLSLLGTLRAASRGPALEPQAGAGRVPLSPDVKVSALLGAHAEALPILIEAGFAPLANPLLRGTFARMITLRNACAMRGIELESLMVRLRAACPHPTAPDVA